MDIPIPHWPTLPPFLPPWWLRSGHLQTLAGAVFGSPGSPPPTQQRRVALDDGDQLVVHDSQPDNWSPSQGAVLLLHGLSGHAGSPLVVRLAERLVAEGRRVFRLDLRCCGAGRSLALRPYHAGCSNDLAAVIQSITDWTTTAAQTAPLLLFGVSLSGNIVLKYLGEEPARVPRSLAGAMVVNPPLDLARSIATLKKPLNWGYDRYFVRALRRHLREHLAEHPTAPRPAHGFSPRSLWAFDDGYTSVVSGFRDAPDYYARCSAAQFLHKIAVPTWLLSAHNDPIVPWKMLEEQRSRLPTHVHLQGIPGGGHVGYVSRNVTGRGLDSCWLDQRVVDFSRTIFGP